MNEVCLIIGQFESRSMLLLKNALLTQPNKHGACMASLGLPKVQRYETMAFRQGWIP